MLECSDNTLAANLPKLQQSLINFHLFWAMSEIICYIHINIVIYLHHTTNSYENVILVKNQDKVVHKNVSKGCN